MHSAGELLLSGVELLLDTELLLVVVAAELLLYDAWTGMALQRALSPAQSPVFGVAATLMVPGLGGTRNCGSQVMLLA